MRIIAGVHRGKRLAQFGGDAIRPTPDRVKESLFQILGPRIAGARVLDLFAGSGALGLEALSRGASEAVFNDVSAESRALLQKNLKATGERGEVYGLDFAACLMRLTGRFDIVFCDPPYRDDRCAAALGLIAQRGLLEEDGVVVYESEREETPPEGWTAADVRRYGRVKVFFFVRSGK